MTRRAPVALTIAGSDSGGGAGIQADLKTFAALGVYGASVITAVTAQNTVDVMAVYELPREFVGAQIDAVATDFPLGATKTGMLSNSGIIEMVASKVEEYRLQPLVVDPVMVAKGGARLLRDDAVHALRDRLLPLASVVTPNIPEAEALLGRRLESWDDIREGAKAIVAMGAKAVVMKGGHLDGPAIDLLYDGEEFREYAHVRIDTKNTHGTGCTFASAITAGLARGETLRAAVALAKAFVTKALQMSYELGSGHGPVHHFYRYWQPAMVDDGSTEEGA